MTIELTVAQKEKDCNHCWHDISHPMPFGGYDYRRDFCCQCRQIRDVDGNKVFWEGMED